jgi:aryl-alcohol dehydrogenase-like predicted oxidoreductase
MQDQYNLLQPEEGREMHPFCSDRGVGVSAWSPLARGKFTRPRASPAFKANRMNPAPKSSNKQRTPTKWPSLTPQSGVVFPRAGGVGVGASA